MNRKEQKTQTIIGYIDSVEKELKQLESKAEKTKADELKINELKSQYSGLKGALCVSMTDKRKMKWRR